jgi:hypothetical protein
MEGLTIVESALDKRGISGEGEGTPDAVPVAEETVSA